MTLEKSEVRVTLANSKLWEKFHNSKTEMVVTKTGRKIFPKLEYKIEGMEEDTHYGLYLEIERVDDNRYKFSAGDWLPAGRAELSVPVKSIAHHDGFRTGKQWMSGPINFERVKITNNPNDTGPAHIYLQSMHRYIPVITVLRVNATAGSMPMMPVSSTPPCIVAKVKLECTEFIAVTAYQNQGITKLKIEYNPFAKGFRDGGSSNSPGERSRKRESTSPLSSDSSKSPRISPPIGMMPVMPLGFLGGLHNPLSQMHMGTPTTTPKPPVLPFMGTPTGEPPRFLMPQFYNNPFFNPLAMFNPAMLFNVTPNVTTPYK